MYIPKRLFSADILIHLYDVFRDFSVDITIQCTKIKTINYSVPTEIELKVKNIQIHSLSIIN